MIAKDRAHSFWPAFTWREQIAPTVAIFIDLEQPLFQAKQEILRFVNAERWVQAETGKRYRVPRGCA
jgi:hypothetical protein